MVLNCCYLLSDLIESSSNQLPLVSHDEVSPLGDLMMEFGCETLKVEEFPFKSKAEKPVMKCKPFAGGKLFKSSVLNCYETIHLI